MSIGGAHQRLRIAVLEHDGYLCQIHGPGCTTVATHADHIVPRAFGGGHTLDNYRAACAHCNCARNARPRKSRRENSRHAFFSRKTQEPTAYPPLSPTPNREKL